MKALSQSAFKQWQALPLLSRPLWEGAEANRLAKCRAVESAGPSGAKPERGECRPRQSGTGPDAGDLQMGEPTIQVFQRP